MFPLSNNSETSLGECPYCSFGGDVCKKHVRLEPLFRKQGNPLSLSRSYGGKYRRHL
jgi:hypothetical protein